MKVLVMHDDRRVAQNLAAALKQSGVEAVETRQRSRRSHRAWQMRARAGRPLRPLAH